MKADHGKKYVENLNNYSMIYTVDVTEEKKRKYILFSPSHLGTEREKSKKKHLKHREIARKLLESIRKFEVQ